MLQSGAMSKRDKRSKGARKGIPRSVQRNAGGKPVIQLDMPAARVTWLLDLLAWARHGGVAARIDLRGQRAALPPVVLPVETGRLVAMEDAAAITRLRSRHRAFSQIAGRYTPLVVGAGDAGATIHLEIWHLPEGEPDPAETEHLEKLAPQLAEFLGAEIVLLGRKDAAEALKQLDAGSIPAAIEERNPLAWQLALLRDAL